MERRWKVAETPPGDMRERFPELHPIVVQLLWNRGLSTQEDVDRFLLPDYGQDLHDPFLFKDMVAACERVWNAIVGGESVRIHGDYDADGVTGTAVLVSTFRAVAEKIGGSAGTFGAYLPHREKEGYGVRKATIDRFAEEGVALMVTVDCGISCAPEIAHARSLGIDTIVVDHHQVPEEVPECLIIHPLAPGERYPYTSLAAVGVAFKFASAFIRYAEEKGVTLDPGFEKWLLDLVAIATVTDFVPLVGENRTLEKYGLIVLNKTRRPGLRKIIENARLELGALDTVSVGFYIGPRINAASRMDHADRAFEALMAKDESDAETAAMRLEELNGDRQRYTFDIVRDARAQVEEAGDVRVHFLIGEGWSPGIVGLVAGKIVSETGVPTFVFGKDGDNIVGSGRGIPDFDLVKGLEASRDHLTRFGGHPRACGLTITGDAAYEAFCDAFRTYADENLSGKDLRPVIDVDAELSTSQITWDLVDKVLEFEPYGEGNPRPKFLLKDVVVTSVTPVGKDGKHVRLGVRGDAPKEMKVIAFGMADRAAEFLPGSRIDVVAELGINVWNGSKSIEIKCVDMRLSGMPVTADLKDEEHNAKNV